jgi:lipid II:glycine glycyltransferase (peptidoglycan interpeptide bridge formation enzyme)
MTQQTDPVPRHRRTGRTGPVDPLAGPGDVHLRRTRGVEDPDWDSFVATAPDGHYQQSTSWGRFKAGAGWRTSRVHVSRGDETIAGAQLLSRPVTGLGSIGYVTHGLVLGERPGEVVDTTLDGVFRLCHAERVRFVVVRPPRADGALEERLLERGFRESRQLRTPSATLRVDLSAGRDELLGQMRRSTRGNIRRGLSRGLVAREGGTEDLGTFLHLLGVAAARKGFTTFAASRYEAMWGALRADARARLFLVERDGEPVAAQLAVPHGDTFYTHLMAWSGEHARLKPNELLEWTAMTWAKENGYRFYDFEGVEGDGDVDRDDSWVSDYKLGFGGYVVAVARAYDHVFNPVLRWGYRSVVLRLQDRPEVKRLEKRVRRRISGRRRAHRATTGSGTG